MIRIGDILVVLAAAGLIGAMYAATWQSAAAAAEVVVRSPRQAPVHHDLDHAQRLEIAGKQGTSVVLIESGRVRFIQSPCAGQYCVHQGWLDQAGDFAACLPNGVSLTLTGNGARFDAFAY